MTRKTKVMFGSFVGLVVIGIATYAYVRQLKVENYNAEAQVELNEKKKRADESRKEIKRLEGEINDFEASKAIFYRKYDAYIKRKGPGSSN